MKYAVIPAYNEEDSIGQVVTKLRQYVDLVVVINDCSSDETAAISSNYGAFVINNKENKGYEQSLLRGIKYAVSNKASIILTFDADGQHPYDKVEEMFNLIETNTCDIVIGNRGKLPRISEKIFSLYTSLKFNIPDILCGMKCYSSRMLIEQALDCQWDSVVSYITLRSVKLGYKCKSIPIPQIPRPYGSSRYGKTLIAEKRILHAFIRSFFI